jgi:UDP-N-acetylmuramoyl-L-alanyl-D-glutamate--2,6-diaminopimelate ligase
VDYAHTPDALENVLTTLREICSGKLWCVFGCGGDRDKTKRPMMGAIAEKLADYIIITDDNPRTESAQNIVADVLTGISSSQAAMIEHNRLKAITYAIHHAKPDDLILVAGKGHEHYQEINQQRYPFNDGEVVQQLLSLL